MTKEPYERPRLFVDMDGTLAVFTPVDNLEVLYEKGYFLNLEPINNVVGAIKSIIRNNPEIEVNTLSAYLAGNPYAIAEKNQWLDQYLPEIDQAHRIFSPCGCDKTDFVPGGVKETDYLLDDYTQNLKLWPSAEQGIKLLNGINHTKGTWEHHCIRFDKQPTEIASSIMSIIRTNEIVRHEKPGLHDNDIPKTIEYYKSLGVFNMDQLMEIRWGLEDGFDVSSYANPEYSPREMELRRLDLLRGIDPQTTEYTEILDEWEQEQ